MSALQRAAERIAAEADDFYQSPDVDGSISREAFSDAAIAFNDWAQYQDDDDAKADWALYDGTDHEHADTAAHHPHAWYENHHNPDEWIEEALSEYGADIAMDSGNIMTRLKELGAYSEARAAFNAVMGLADDLADEYEAGVA